ncbi:MAG: dethiobiotin synthase [Proteobacteria bacterium]|nr:dethiobiotin synthase [Pseudomonadota bacterium]
MSARLFVAGSHTDVGKTHVACALLRAARGRGLRAEALKPVASGFDPEAWADSDPGRLLAALGEAPTAEALDRMTPWRFAAPLAPPSAAKLEGRSLPLGPLVDLCAERLAATGADLFLIESAGGLMSPLADGATCLDLLDALDMPTLLVGGSYLGAISHTLTAAEVLRARGRPARALVISQDADPAAPDFAETLALVVTHAGGVPVFPAPRGADEGWTAPVLDALLGP